MFWPTHAAARMVGTHWPGCSGSRYLVALPDTRMSMTPSAYGTIRRCAGSSAAKPSCAVQLRRVRLAALRPNGLLQTRTFLLLPTCPANGSTCALRPGNVHSADGWKDVLDPVVQRYRGKVTRIYFRADAAFAMPGVYEFLEARRIKYAIRLPANQVLQSRIGYLLKRPIGRPPNEVRRFHANFSYQAATWTKPRRVIAKVEWHPGELYPRVVFIVTNMSRPAERVVAFYKCSENILNLLNRL